MGEAAGTVLGATVQADAQRRQGRFEEAQAQINARFAEVSALDAEVRGRREAENVRAQGRQVAGSQRAQMAAAGLSIEGDTSAAQVVDQTQVFSELDAQTVLNNAFKEAWGFREEAAQTRGRGRLARIMGSAGAEATLLTGYSKAYAQASEAAAKAAAGGA